MKVRVLPSALNDLDEIEVYVGTQFGLATATRTSAKLFDAFQLLAGFPELGRPRQDVTGWPVRFFLVKPYWIVYEVRQELMIHRVYHAARDLARFRRT